MPPQKLGQGIHLVIMLAVREPQQFEFKAGESGRVFWQDQITRFNARQSRREPRNFVALWLFGDWRRHPLGFVIPQLLDQLRTAGRILNQQCVGLKFAC